ncbi:MAG TPA: carboxylating nicotinate-nucleotide diphosphorylase [Opitutus sp.]|nr:carboxylating nicotinate-nucleotide diphosphorylase [Opitutus sp.]
MFAGLAQTVAAALAEDIGSGDITAALVPENQMAQARVMCREHAVICGEAWVDEVFRQVSPAITVQWQRRDGDRVRPEDSIFVASGPARALLTAERTALNFLQTLSGVATAAREYADLVMHTNVKILDTRKTLPGLRLAQKYAVRTGGCHNHRLGLYDAFLIKENHIAACGSIAAAIATARKQHADRPVEVEVETLAQLEEALTARADIVMLDNFTLEQTRSAVVLNEGRAKLEASGGFTTESLVAVAETGVDYISVGSLTKHVRATDFTMLFTGA